MAVTRWVHVVFFCGFFSIQPLAEDPKECLHTNGQCDGQSLSDLDEESMGHALLATRAVISKIGGHQLLPEQRFAEQATSSHKAPVSHGSIAAIAALLDANHTQPFQGSSDPIADQKRHDADYVVDDDGPWLIFPKAKPLSQSFNVTLEDIHDTVEKKIHLAKFVVVPLAFVFLAVFTISNIMEKFQITSIPESAIMVVIGVLLGTYMKRFAHFDVFEESDAFGQMNSCLLNLVLLPIIIFASGWSVRRQDFYSQFPYILMFAIGGVALSTVVIACLINLTGSMGLHDVSRWRTAFAFASLISATDPVATLSTYSKLKVDPLLNIIVFGESIINDAVAIVLFNVFNADEFMVNSRGESLTGGRLLVNIVVGILKIFCGSTLLGTGLGMVYTFIAHWADMRHNKKGQILVILAACYLTYAIAEACGMSGIIAEMFSALLMGVYMRPHLSKEGSLLATFFVKQLAALADAAVCLLIGVAVVNVTSKGWYFGLWAMLFCLIGRFAAVYPLAFLVNYVKTVRGKASGVPPEGWNLLSNRHMFMMWHAGLRGAIALALALELGQWVDELDGKGTRRALQTATFFLICTFLLVFGGSTSACLQQLGIPTGIDQPADFLSKTESHGPTRAWLNWLDVTVMSPLLIGKTLKHQGEQEKDVEDVLRGVLPKTNSHLLKP